jgi:hypothetical protein
MGKEEVMRRAREWANEKFHIRLSVEFLRRYTTPELYGLMRAVAQGKWHHILTKWQSEQKIGVEAQPAQSTPSMPTPNPKAPIPGTAEAKQLKLF